MDSVGVNKRKYDIIVFGATGFTGKHVIEEIVNTKNAGHSESFTWAISGRSEEKLNAVLKEMGEVTGVDLTTVEKVIASVDDVESLTEMARQCRVLINAVGPYAYYGEPVIKACIQEGTHHVDVSAEAHNLTQMQILYHTVAEEKGVYIVGSCGFDSIPNECGINFLQQNFEGELNSVESYLYIGSHIWTNRVNYGSWESLLRFYDEFGKLRPLLKKLYPQELPKPKYKLKSRLIHHNNVGETGWCLIFPHPDVWAVERSQNYFYATEKQRPIQFGSYLKQSNIFLTMYIAIGAVLLGILLKCGLVSLMEKFPRLFSGNLVSHAGPTRAQMKAFDFSFTLIGKGWDTKLENPEQDHPNSPDKTMVAQILGNNPGYGVTPIGLIQSALVILHENHLMPSKGGVYTPGPAFAKTSIVNRLSNHGLTFNILNEYTK